MKRIVELDYFRGIAIVLMVIFHAVFDLSYYFGIDIDYTRGFWYYEGKLSAIMFIAIAGVSSCFSHRPVLRGVRLFLLGMVLTAATYTLDKTNYIKFGILHFLGSAYTISGPLKRMKLAAVILLGTAAIATGIYFNALAVRNPYLFPFGLTTRSFASLDYYPLLPYFGVFLYGTALGRLFYARGFRLLGGLTDNPLSRLGRHSLFIYLVHQPILLLLLYLAERTGLL
ncbi:heparan-alpha-glucosaminide N-acetyltransferase [Thermosediminibacter litoriperuensis]|uniref:Putative membrane protein n=1 Tax=Thermosediminibacter litoriperuensis TaxID=291989 RepID=A0A5S5ANU6_9FIRM|nr:heparan-alpha-glucosaminide N-acetyltransferase [Thermosediminibacter litoriperuensis]TYP53333.1 putative membrane protein [Thermosediminibacter litoriperuensis]